MKIWQVPNQQMDEVRIKVSRQASQDQSDELLPSSKTGVISRWYLFILLTITWDPVEEMNNMK